MLDACQKIRRILITGDVLRPLAHAPGKPATRPNVRWLSSLLAWPLAQVTSLPVSCVSWGEGFDADAFYRAVGLSPDIHGWARVHYAQTLPKAAEACIESAYSEALVIGCETTPCIAEALHRLGIPLVDTIAHPLRFLDDILNAWRSNHRAIAERLADHRYDLTNARAQAGLIRAKMAWRPRLSAPDNMALLIGQVGSDKALIHRTEGRLIGFGDFVDSLVEMEKRHAAVLYKPHPYEDRFGNSASVVRQFKSFHVTKSNFYWLVSQDQIADVYAISSGTCEEAPYFGKAGRYLYSPLYTFDDGSAEAATAGLSTPVPVEHAWLWPQFWHSALEPVLPVVKPTFSQMPYRANRIRRSLNADWNFGEVDAVVNNSLQ